MQKDKFMRMLGDSNISIDPGPIFIVGCPRSGTTLMRNLLRSHPNLSFPEESHFIPGFYKVFGDPESGREAVELAKNILGLKYIQDWALEISPEAFKTDRSYAQVVDRLFSAWAQQEGKSRWGDKTPQYVLQIPTVAEIFPGAQFIHMVRDGREVALSWFRMGFGPENIYKAALEWQRYVTAGRTHGAGLDRKHYLEVRYEDLLVNPENTMRRICGFLKEAYTPEILSPTPLPTRGTRRYSVDPYYDKPGQGPTRAEKIIPGNTEKWRQELSKSQKVTFESITGGLLAESGYAMEGQTRRIPRAEKVYWEAHHLLHSTIKRLRGKNKLQWLATDLKLRLASWIRTVGPDRKKNDANKV